MTLWAAFLMEVEVRLCTCPTPGQTSGRICSPTLMPLEPALLCCPAKSQGLLSSAVADGQLSRVSWQPLRDGTTYAQPLDVQVVPSSFTDQGHPMFSGGNMSHERTLTLTLATA